MTLQNLKMCIYVKGKYISLFWHFSMLTSVSPSWRGKDLRLAARRAVSYLKMYVKSSPMLHSFDGGDLKGLLWWCTGLVWHRMIYGVGRQWGEKISNEDQDFLIKQAKGTGDQDRRNDSGSTQWEDYRLACATCKRVTNKLSLPCGRREAWSIEQSLIEARNPWMVFGQNCCHLFTVVPNA